MKARTAVLFRLFVLGAVCIGIAGFARMRLAHKPSAPAPASPSLDALKAELGSLLAGEHANPKDSKPRWKLVAFYQRNNLDSLALEQLKAITYLEPHNPRAPLALAQIFMAEKQYAQSETAYHEIVVHFPREVVAWQGLASSQHQQQRYLEAMDSAKHAVQLAPDDPNSNLIYASASLEYAMQFPNPFAYPEQLTRAYSILIKLQNVWPQNGNIPYLLGRTFGAMHKSKEQLAAYRKAIALLPNSAEVAAALVRAQLDSGDVDGGRQAALQALARNPDDAQLNALLGRAGEMGSTPDAPQQAYLAFQKTTQLKPNIASYQEHLGMACLRLQKLDEAQRAFEKAIEINPNRVFPYQQLAVVYNRMGKPDLARKAAQSAAAMNFNEQQLKRIQNLSEQRPTDVNLHLILADRYKDLRMFGASRDQYLVVLKDDLNNARAKQGLIALAKALEQHSGQSPSAPALPGQIQAGKGPNK